MIYLHEQFLRQAQQAPHALALRCAGRDLDYGALAQRVLNQAQALRRAGVAPGNKVVIGFPRSEELVVSMLACLCSGAVCVPVDPHYPATRVAAILGALRASGPRWLLTNIGTRAHYQAQDEALRWLALDEHAALAPSTSAPATVDGDDDAFILFTSGSLGTPKGVIMTHGGRTSRQDWTQARYACDARDRHLLKSPVGFGTLLREIFWPLTTGGCLVVGDEEVHRDPGRLAHALATEEITILNATPSLLRALLDQAAFPHASLRHVFCTGEALTAELQRRFLAQPVAALHMFYGATEVPTATCWDFARDGSAPELTLGVPTDMEVLLVADDGAVLPGPHAAADAQAIGEIWVSGPGLARGYLGDPDATAQRFVPHPLRAQARAYRTGDLARWLSDGRLAYHGRRDDQLKLAGQRISLDEVRAHLLAHDAIHDAQVIARRGAESQARDLVAYYTPAAGTLCTPEALRAYLRARLPLAAVPVAFVPLPELPRDAHGKLARTELPAPRRAHFSAESPARAPSGLCEQALAQAWTRALPGSEPAPDDTFLDLGGQSVAALSVVRHVQTTLGIELSVSRLLARVTLATLAAELETQRATALVNQERASMAPSSALELTTVEWERVHEVVRACGPDARLEKVALCSSAQTRLWFMSRMSPRSTAWSLGTVQALGPAQGCPDRLARAWRALCEREPALRSLFAEVKGRLLQITLQPACARVHLLELSPDAQTEQIEELAARSLLRPLAALTAETASLTLALRGGRVCALFITTHHLACDASSRALLLRDLGALYTHGPEQPTQRHAPRGSRTPRADHELASAYWQRKLHSPPAPVVPPRDRYATGEAPPAGRVAQAITDTRVLRRFARDRQVTLANLIAASLALTLARWTRARDLTLGIVVSLREQAARDDAIGCFLNVLPLRLMLDDALSVGAWIDEVARGMREALEHRQLPFERIVAAVPGARSDPESPLFDVVLNVLSGESHALVLAGQPARALRCPALSPRYRLELYVRDRDHALELELCYDQDHYGGPLVAAMLKQLVAHCLDFAADERRPIAALGAHRVAAYGSAPAVAPAQASVVERIWRAAQARPDAIAVRTAQGCLRYGELRDASERLVRALLTAGMRADQTVIVTGASSLALVCAMLAVLRMRCTLVLLDPALPPLRFRDLCARARAQHVVSIDVRPPDPADLGAHVFTSDLEGLEPLSGEDAHAIRDLPWPRPEAPAYITFTSGSSGTPRAVVARHESVANVLAWQSQRFAIGADDRVALTNGLGFDPVLRDVLLPLSVGAQLCIPDAETRTAPAELMRFLAEQGITLAHLTPTMGRAWHHLRAGARPNLRWLFFAGEPLPLELAESLRESLGERVGVVNLYGATEATMIQLHHELDATAPRGPVVAGSPIAGAQVQVRRGAYPCAVGEIGEIIIASPFIAHGYLDGTPSERFAEPGLYRTGDYGRLRADRALEVLGRDDDQLNLGGLRLSAAEVERALLAHPAVAAACLASWGDGLSSQMGIAWVAQQSSATPPSSAELRAFLAQRLPAAMVPSVYARTRELPGTANGKTSRQEVSRWLRDARRSEPTAEQPPSGAAPASPTELRLLILFRSLLGHAVELDTCFLEAGGNSLLALRLLAEIQGTFGCELPVRALFPRATVRELSARIQAAAATEPGPCVLLQDTGAATPLVCVHPAGGSILCYLALAARFAGARPVFGIEDPEVLSAPREQGKDVRTMAQRYAAAVRARTGARRVHLLGYSFGGVLAFELARALRAQGSDVGQVILLDSAAPGDASPEGERGLIGAFAQMLEHQTLSAGSTVRHEHELWREMTNLALTHAEGRAAGVTNKSGALRFGEVQRLFREHGLLPLARNLEYGELRSYLLNLRESFRAARAYRPDGLAAPVLYIKAALSADMGPARVDYWRRFVSRLDVIEISTTHLALLREPALSTVVTRLQARMQADDRDHATNTRTVLT